MGQGSRWMACCRSKKTSVDSSIPSKPHWPLIWRHMHTQARTRRQAHYPHATAVAAPRSPRALAPQLPWCTSWLLAHILQQPISTRFMPVPSNAMECSTLAWMAQTAVPAGHVAFLVLQVPWSENWGPLGGASTSVPSLHLRGGTESATRRGEHEAGRLTGAASAAGSCGNLISLDQGGQPDCTLT